jgi:hypothetical protein
MHRFKLTLLKSLSRHDWNLPHRLHSPSPRKAFSLYERPSPQDLLGCVTEASLKILVIGTFVGVPMGFKADRPHFRPDSETTRVVLSVSIPSPIETFKNDSQSDEEPMGNPQGLNMKLTQTALIK